MPEAALPHSRAERRLRSQLLFPAGKPAGDKSSDAWDTPRGDPSRHEAGLVTAAADSRAVKQQVEHLMLTLPLE